MCGQVHGGQSRCSSKHHGGSPAVSKHSKGKSIDFEGPGELGTRVKDWGQTLCSSKCRGLGPREQECWGNAWVLKSQGLKVQMGAGMGTLPGCVSRGCSLQI
jgi:hypothetical protein